jgi:hypothetical protein
MEIGIILFWIGLAIVVGVAANTRGRSGGSWFLLAVIVSPLIAGLLLLALARKQRSPESMKKCPYCAQMIPLEALVCHVCRRDVDTPENVEIFLAERMDEQKSKARNILIVAIVIFGILAVWTFGFRD